MNPIVSNGNLLRWEFELTQYLGSEGDFSEKFCIGNTYWKIQISKNGPKNNKYLAVYLHYISANKRNQNWICEVSRSIKVLNQKENSSQDCFMRTSSNCYYDEAKLVRGYSKFLNWLEAESGGYIKDDSIIIEVDLSFKYYNFSKYIPSYTDITIKVGGTLFFVNKGVLCSRSEYFYDLFVNKMSEETTIKLPYENPEGFRYFLAFFFPFFDSVNVKNYKQLINLAARFEVPIIQKSCEKFLISNTEMKMTMKLKYADKHNYHDLMKTCIESFESVDEIKKIQESAEFRYLKDTTKLSVMRRILDFLGICDSCSC